MAIDASGKWWVGSEPQDLKVYLEAYSADGYKVNEFRLAICNCGNQKFLQAKFKQIDNNSGPVAG